MSARDGVAVWPKEIAADPPIVLSGQLWTQRNASPWGQRSGAPRVTILAVLDGWVRYDFGPDFGGGSMRDERMKLSDFLACYEPLPFEAEQTEEEKLRDRFETWAHNHGWMLTRDKASGIYHDNVTQYGWKAFLAGARGLEG